MMTEEKAIEILFEELNSDYGNDFGFKDHPTENDTVMVILDGEVTKVKLVRDIIYSIIDGSDQEQIDELKEKIVQILDIFGFDVERNGAPKLKKKKKLDSSKNVYLKIMKHNKIKDSK